MVPPTSNMRIGLGSLLSNDIKKANLFCLNLWLIEFVLAGSKILIVIALNDLDIDL
jgi:hypothetical protein